METGEGSDDELPGMEPEFHGYVPTQRQTAAAEAEEGVESRARYVKYQDKHSLETANDPNNYQPFTKPERTEEIKVVLSKATKDHPEVSRLWTNEKRAENRVGRRPAENTNFEEGFF